MALSICNSTADKHGRELVMHGTTAFPLGCYHDNLALETVPWHWHDELEAVIIESGECLFSVGTKTYTLKPGNGIFINAGILHTVSDLHHTGCRIHSFCFHPRLVGGSLDSIYWLNYLQPLISDLSLEGIPLDASVDWHREALEAIEAAWQSCVAEEPGYEFQARSLLSRLILLLVSHRPLTVPAPSEKSLRDGARIKTMLQFIQEHYSEELSTGQIAASASLSCSEALRCFRSTIGTTPIQYVKQYRIQQAARLLLSSQDKITDIGARCGFQEMSYFAKAFKALMGNTPSEYRRIHSQA